MRLNLGAVLHVTHAYVGAMVDAGGGGSSRSCPTPAARASACRRSTARRRRARWASCRGLAAEVGAHGVTANCVVARHDEDRAARRGAIEADPELEQRLARPYPVPRVGEPDDPTAARGPALQRRRAPGSPARCIPVDGGYVPAL